MAATRDAIDERTLKLLTQQVVDGNTVAARQILSRWKTDPFLASARSPTVGTKEELESWNQHWNEVELLLKKASKE